MTIMFEHLFRDHILQRGYDYFQNGAVCNLKRDTNQIWAVVQGSENYDVYVELKDDSIASLDCTCPYFQDSHNCKHLAAVFYALEEGDSELGVRSDLSLSLEILESLPPEDMREILGRELEFNEDLRTRFLSMYQEPGRSNESLLLREIDSVFRFHLGSAGYIEYDEVDAFSSDVHGIISSIKNLVDEEKYESAFTLAWRLVNQVSTVAIDDSLGTTTWIMGELIDIVKRILDEGPDFLHQVIFGWLCSGLEEGMFHDHSSQWTDVLMIYFSAEDQLHKKLALINEKLQHFEGSRLSRRTPMYIYWLGHKLKTLWGLGYEEEANRLFGNNSDLPEIWLLMMERHLRYGEDQKAVWLLQEGKDRFRDNLGMVDRYSCELMKIYRRQGDRHDLRREGLFRVLQSAPGRLDAYLEYKSMVPPQEWPGERDYILYRLREKGVDLKSIYAKEELWADLLVSLQEKSLPWDLDLYEKLLKDTFPEEIRDLLVRRVIESATLARGRKHYARINDELQRIEEYPGGTAIVEELREKWTKQYKNRPAMME